MLSSKRGNASRIVTLAPARAYTWLNSSAITPPPTNTTLAGRLRSLNTSSEVIISSAPGNGNRRGVEPVAITTCFASSVSPPTTTVLGPAKRPWSRITSTPRLLISCPSEAGMPDIIAFSRSISAAQSRARLADRDVMRHGALDLVERVCRRDQHLLRHAAAVGAGAAEQIRLDHRDREPGLPRRHGDTHPGIATAEDHDIEAACGHGLIAT